MLDQRPREWSRLPLDPRTTLPEPLSLEDARRRTGRRLALTVFYALVVLFTLGAAAQISIQVYSANTPWDAGCEQGLRSLERSIRVAQGVSEGGGSAEESLQRFRRSVAPAWGARDTIERACRATGDPRMVEAFDAIERLRYAEESAIRREGNELAPLRRRVHGLLGGLSGGAAPLALVNVETSRAGPTRLAST